MEDHCERAVRAALDMVDNLAVFNLEQAAMNRAQVKIGIGIASGQMIAGYTGTQHRATYTCVGDTVNLAARIEEHTKIAGLPILIDQNTCNELPESIEREGLGPVLFKGKQQAVNIFSVRK
jgi:class 3 adenylate cyclase